MPSQTVHQNLSIFKSISTEHSQQFKAFELKYLGPVEVIILVITLEYELAWQILIY